MLISRFVTVYLLPLPVILSFFGLLPIGPMASMLGALSGYALLAAIGWLFKVIMKKPGIGQGDIVFLSFIGAFLGFGGWWISLLIGSLIGSITGIIYLAYTRQGKNCKIPFGPFLAIGAMLYALWGQQIVTLFFPHLP